MLLTLSMSPSPPPHTKRNKSTHTQLVADPEVSKRLTYKMLDRSVPTQLTLDPQTDMVNRTGLAAAR